MIAAVLHELLNREQFGSLADAAEALKCSCARLRVRYTGEQIAEALRSVAHTRPVLQLAARRGEWPSRAFGSPRPGVEWEAGAPQLSHGQALEALERVRRGPA